MPIETDRRRALIRRLPDPATEKIVARWPQGFDAKRARDLGLVAETSFDDIIRSNAPRPPSRARQRKERRCFSVASATI